MSDDQTFQPNWINPPSQTILALLAANDIHLEEFSRISGMSHAARDAILSDNAKIDPNLGAQLSSCLGGSAIFWVNRWDKFEEDFRWRTVNNNLQEYRNWLRDLPLRDMFEFGWVQRYETRAEQAVGLLRFFQVKSLTEWLEKYQRVYQIAAFRHSQTTEPSQAALISWIQAARNKACGIDCNAWDQDMILNAIPYIRKLTFQKDPAAFLPKIQSIFKESGVALVVVPAPKNSRVFGMATKMENGAILLALTFRYKTDDQFWFTLFHELGHLILHSNQELFLDGPDLLETHEMQEREANEFAENALIPVEFHDELATLKRNYKSIVRFASKVGVSPGIVIGQMQNKKYIEYNQMNHLKRKYNWESLTNLTTHEMG